MTTTKFKAAPEILAGNIAVVGKTGSGKSYTAKGFAETLLEAGKRLCILDPTGIWWGLRSTADGKNPGFPVMVFGGDHADVSIDENQGAGKAIANFIAARQMSAIVDLSSMTMGGRTRFATAFFDTLYHQNRNVLTLIADEADLFAPQRAMPDQTVMLSRFEQIVRRGRVRGFRTWLITQRPAELHKSVLSQSDVLVAMKLPAPQDRDAIGAWIDGQADRAEGKRVLADLPKLHAGEGYVWAPAHELLTRAHFPEITTYDSGRTPKEGEFIGKAVHKADIELKEIVAAQKELEEFGEREHVKWEMSKKTGKIEERVTDEGIKKAIHEARVEGDRIGYARGRADAFGDLTSIADSIKAARERLESAEKDISTLKQIAQSFPDGISLGKTSSLPPEDLKKKLQSNRFYKEPGTTWDGSKKPLAKAERAILTALAQYPNGRTKKQVAVLTGYAHDGGGFNNALSSLRSRAYMIGPPELLTITESGKAALGNFMPLPSGHSLLEYWCLQLGKAEREILRFLYAVYPESATKEQIAQETDYEATGGGFNNALSRLRTLELITRGNEIRATDEFFE